MSKILAGGAACLAAVLSFSAIAVSQEGKPGEVKKSAVKGEAKSGAEKIKGRVPANYGKVDLTPEQREKIYVIQAQYDAKLESLKEQIKTLAAQRDAEVEAVLTAEQKAKLEKTRAESKKKTEEKVEAKKKEAEAKKTEGKKPGSTETPSTKTPTEKPSAE